MDSGTEGFTVPVMKTLNLPKRRLIWFEELGGIRF